MSKAELNEMIDSVQRAIDAVDYCGNLFTNAGNAFRNEASSLQACKRRLERYQRM